MPKYYCDYCKSYLTHDTMSVRKSHLMGRNHIKYYCDYYEHKAKQTGIWTPLDLPYEVTTAYLNRGAPGASAVAGNGASPYECEAAYALPPPPTMASLPPPPPSAVRHVEEYRRAIARHQDEPI
jgi:U1 small nuclear ribonucleoprotein C